MKYDMMKTTLRVAYTALTILYFTLPGLPLSRLLATASWMG